MRFVRHKSKLQAKLVYRIAMQTLLSPSGSVTLPVQAICSHRRMSC